MDSLRKNTRPITFPLYAIKAAHLLIKLIRCEILLITAWMRTCLTFPAPLWRAGLRRSLQKRVCAREQVKSHRGVAITCSLELLLSAFHFNHTCSAGTERKIALLYMQATFETTGVKQLFTCRSFQSHWHVNYVCTNWSLAAALWGNCDCHFLIFEHFFNNSAALERLLNY